MAKMTLREAGIRVLTERGPLHYQELTQAVLDAGLAESSSATPDASLNAMSAVDIKRKGKQSTLCAHQARGVRSARQAPRRSARLGRRGCGTASRRQLNNLRERELVELGIGVRKRTVELLEVDLSHFQTSEMEG